MTEAILGRWELWIDTYTGKRIDLRAFKASDMCIEDIAHSLSMQCRFNGHCVRFYSVAEHSVRASEIVQANGNNTETQLSALLHDAAEAYYGDIIRPMKAWLRVGNKFERLQGRIFAHFGCSFGSLWAVQAADMDLLCIEARDLLGRDWEPVGPHGVAPSDYSVGDCMMPNAAEERFLERFHELVTPRETAGGEA